MNPDDFNANLNDVQRITYFCDVQEHVSLVNSALTYHAFFFMFLVHMAVLGKLSYKTVQIIRFL